MSLIWPQFSPCAYLSGRGALLGSGGACYCHLRLPVRPSDPSQTEGGL